MWRRRGLTLGVAASAALLCVLLWWWATGGARHDGAANDGRHPRTGSEGETKGHDQEGQGGEQEQVDEQGRKVIAVWKELEKGVYISGRLAKDLTFTQGEGEKPFRWEPRELISGPLIWSLEDQELKRWPRGSGRAVIPAEELKQYK